MGKVYTQKERADWMRSLPSKKIGGLVAIRNEDGHYLLENPSYRDIWILPGGVIEGDESPLTGALREVQEELGLDVDVDRISFEGTFYIPSYKDYVDFLNSIFSFNIHEQEIADITVCLKEVEGYKFVPLDEFSDYMPDFLADGFKHLLQHKEAVFYDGSIGVSV